MPIPMVSIIIPVYNRPVLVAEGIESVLAQTSPNWELIVVDDGSTDNTWQVLESYTAKDERIRVFKRDREPKGAPTCRNIGAELAKGEYLIFFDSDDLLLPHCFAGRLKAFKENPEMDFLVFPMGMKNLQGEIIEKVIPECEDFLVEFLAYRLHWGIMCPIWKRDFFQKVGGFKESLPRLNDPELMIRAFLEERVNFKIFNKNDYDSLQVISPKLNSELSEKLFLSLKIFIPEISRKLKNKGQEKKVSFLKEYYSLFFRSYFLPKQTSNTKQPFFLGVIFFKAGVFSFYSFLIKTFFLFVFSISNFFRSKALDFLLK